MNIKSIVALLSLLVFAALPAIGQIKAKQSIRITVTGIPLDEKGRIDGDYPVGESGTINMPFIGAVRAAGLRTEVLAATLQSRYKSAGIYRNPTFQVFATASGSGVVEQVVVVGGSVVRSGPVGFTEGLTLWGAIQSAGGPTPFGSMKRVKLTRRGKVKQYNVEQGQFRNIPLEPDDAIDVPEKNMWGG
jgi:polysaccharide export outer membrane protein